MTITTKQLSLLQAALIAHQPQQVLAAHDTLLTLLRSPKMDPPDWGSERLGQARSFFTQFERQPRTFRVPILETLLEHHPESLLTMASYAPEARG